MALSGFQQQHNAGDDMREFVHDALNRIGSIKLNLYMAGLQSSPEMQQRLDAIDADVAELTKMLNVLRGDDTPRP